MGKNRKRSLEFQKMVVLKKKRLGFFGELNKSD
jgi:hypothetical protein